jgi:TPR repeat protein
MFALCSAQDDEVEYWCPGMGDVSEKVSTLTRKANAGDSKAALALGFYFSGNRSLTNAVEYLTMAAKKGESEAQFELGQLFMGDRDFSVTNYATARYWLSVAETNGWKGVALEKLGKLNYLEGKGNTLIGFDKAFFVYWTVYNKCKHLEFGIEQKKADREIAAAIYEIKDSRTLFRTLMLLSFFKSESEERAYRRYIEEGIRICIDRLSKTGETALLDEYLAKAGWLSDKNREQMKFKH